MKRNDPQLQTNPRCEMPEVVPEMLKLLCFPGHPTTKGHLPDARRGPHTSTIVDFGSGGATQADCQCVLRPECLSWAISECCMRIGKARAASQRPQGFVLGESDIKRQAVALSALCRLGRIGSRRRQLASCPH